jgi:hypothetical protein
MSRLLSVSLLALVFALVAIPAVVQAQPVELLDAELAYTGDPSCASCYRLRGTVEVENLAYEKQVSVFWTGDGTVWRAAKADYAVPSSSGYEIWRFNIDVGPIGGDPPVVRLAIRYSVAGQDYWDNNGGQDFVVRPNGSYETWPVRVLDAHVGGGLGCYGLCGEFRADILVENLAYAKQVTLVYSVDGGNWTELEATWQYGLHNNRELWRAYVRYLPRRTATVRFAVRYRVAGGEYWDNNFGWDHYATGQ